MAAEGADITYIPIGRGFLYLVAIMDWASRAVLAWRLSNTMDVSFCVSALEEALARFGRPEIFNTDQGSQFTSAAFTGVLASAGIRISMDGRGRWMDNVFIERLWRSLKHEDVYLKGYADGLEAKAGIAEWIGFYNTGRPHQALDNRRPMTVWRDGMTGTLGESSRIPSFDLTRYRRDSQPLRRTFASTRDGFGAWSRRGMCAGVCRTFAGLSAVCMGLTFTPSVSMRWPARRLG